LEKLNKRSHIGGSFARQSLQDLKILPLR